MFTADFDLEKKVPKGKALGDKPIMRRQTNGDAWYISYFQQTSSGPESLWFVEEYRGHKLLRIVEFGQDQRRR